MTPENIPNDHTEERQQEPRFFVDLVSRKSGCSSSYGGKTDQKDSVVADESNILVFLNDTFDSGRGQLCNTLCRATVDGCGGWCRSRCGLWARFLLLNAS